MTTIGYATLAIIPSLEGVSKSIDKQLGFLPGQGTAAGKKLGSNIAAGVRGSEAQISAALSQAVNARGGEKVGQQWADSTASAMAKHLQSAQNTQKLTSSLAFLQKNGDEAGRGFAENMANRLGIDLPAKTKAQRIGERIGQVIAAPLGLAIRGGLLAAAGGAAAGVAGIGYVLTKGFERLESIDQATFKLKALGHSGEETKQIMDNATASVKGTAFSLAEAATTAASAVAAGIQPGKDLTQYLTNVADASAVAGTSLQDMGDVFNGIQTQNKAYTGDLDQLAHRGIPIFQWLAKEYGVTGDALSKMVQKGDVDAAHFNKAISDNIGGAAKNMGQSFQGAVDNAETAVARLGAHFLGSIFGDKDGSQLAGPTAAIGKLSEKFDQIDAWVQAHSAEIHAFFEDIKTVAMDVGGAVKDIGTWLIDNKGAAETLAAVFIDWKVASAVAGAVTGLQKMSVLLGTTLPADAAASAGAIGTGTGIGATGLIGGVFALAGALGVDLGFTIFDKMQKGARDAQAAMDEANRKLHEEFPGVPVTPTGVPAQTGSTGPSNPLNPNNIYDPLIRPPGRAMGGSILGSGSATSDSIPAWLSNGEHVLTAKDVSAMGGQGGVYAFRSMLHRSVGGPIPLGGTGDASPGSADERGGDTGKRSWFGPKPRTKVWGKWENGIMRGPRPSTSGPGHGFRDRNWPWWMFPGDQPSVGSPGPARDHRRDIFLGPHPSIIGGPGGHKLPSDKGYAPPAKSPNPQPWDPAWNPNRPRSLGFKVGGAVNSPNTGGSLTPNASQLKSLVMQAFPQITDIGGWRPPDGYNEHSSGQALDLMIPNPSSPGGKALGDQVNQWLLKNGAALGIQYDLWQQTQWNPDGSTSAMSDRGSPTQNHRDHIHVRVRPGPATGASLSATSQSGPPTTAQPAQTNSAAPLAASASPASSASGASLPSSISGLSAFGLDSLGSGVGTTSSGSDLSVFGKAAGAAVSGQVSSALGVLGVNDSPGWLKAASMLIGGLKVGGHGHPGKSDGSIFNGANPLGGMFGQGSAGSSAAPLSATSTITGTPPPDNAGNLHGTRAGQAPGPVFNTTISAFDTTDALRLWDSHKNRVVAAKLSQY